MENFLSYFQVAIPAVVAWLIRLERRLTRIETLISVFVNNKYEKTNKSN
jgi:hypothetical protein